MKVADFKVDNLDRRILEFLQKDSRMPYLEVARLCNVTGSAIHQRIQKMKDAGVIVGSKVVVDSHKLGYNTCAFVGLQINLVSTKTHEDVFSQIQEITEVVECYHITGRHSMLLKIMCRSNEELKKILVTKVQSIQEITGTETLISLEEGFIRNIQLEK